MSCCIHRITEPERLIAVVDIVSIVFYCSNVSIPILTDY